MKHTKALLLFLLGLMVLACNIPIAWQTTPDIIATGVRETEIMQQALTEIVASLTAIPQKSATIAGTELPLLSPTVTLLPPTSAPILTSTPTQLPTPDPWIEAMLSQMSLKQKIGQMLMIGVEGQALTSATCSLLCRFQPGAVVYTGANVLSPDQLRNFSRDLQDCAQSQGLIPLWIAMDHEGQYVNRFGNSATIFPMAMTIGATGDPNNAYRAAFASGQELTYSGVNMVLGPGADILSNYDNAVISLRSYGEDPVQVGLFVAQAVRGYLAAGVAPVLKHFPGHGGVAGDTHEMLAVDSADRVALRQMYLPSFQAGILEGATGVMFSHVAFPALDEITRPASLSPVIVNLLYDDLAFQGFSLTDSMGMGAIKNTYGDVGAAGVKAVSAGIDMLLTTSAESAQSATGSLLNAVQSGQVPLERINQAVRRILKAKATWLLKDFPVSPSAAPDWTANQAVAYELGYRAVTIVRDQLSLVPLSTAGPRLLVIGPTDGWGLYAALQNSLQASGFTSSVVIYSAPWNGPVPERSYLQSLPAQAASYDHILVFTWEAHLNRLRYNDNFQAELVNRLLGIGKPVIIVALKSPTDLLEFPQASTFLATYGTTSGQIQGIVDVLVGTVSPTGVSPLGGARR